MATRLTPLGSVLRGWEGRLAIVWLQEEEEERAGEGEGEGET